MRVVKYDVGQTERLPMDTQVIELLGRNRLVDELLCAKLEVALPIRDHGIDLIVYADGLEHFSAVPIQMKACSESIFSLDRKYEKFPNLLIAHVWHIATPDRCETFATTFAEAEMVAQAMGWTMTASWAAGCYTNTRPWCKVA